MIHNDVLWMLTDGNSGSVYKMEYIGPQDDHGHGDDHHGMRLELGFESQTLIQHRIR